MTDHDREHPITHLTYPDGLVERVVWREFPDGTWTPFSECPKCGSENSCVCYTGQGMDLALQGDLSLEKPEAA